MKLYVKDLYEMQDELDQRIFDEHGITRVETMNRRMLALLIEIGELANETRCFKFWSNKGASSKDVVLEEYADGIHFLLSLGIDLKDKENEIEMVALDGELSDAFLMIYDMANELSRHFSLTNYYMLFGAYLSIAQMLGYSCEDIREHYLLKNKENHHRQDVNY
ncbi:MAG: dUTP diphosphatase [Erysipelotrichaceae bacterium]